MLESVETQGVDDARNDVVLTPRHIFNHVLANLYNDEDQYFTAVHIALSSYLLLDLYLVQCTSDNNGCPKKYTSLYKSDTTDNEKNF